MQSLNDIKQLSTNDRSAFLSNSPSAILEQIVGSSCGMGWFTVNYNTGVVASGWTISDMASTTAGAVDLVAGSEYGQYKKRSVFAASASATAVAGIRTSAFGWRGDDVGRGGFDLWFQFGPADNISTGRSLCGVINSVTDLTDLNPSDRLTSHFFAFGNDSADTKLYLFTNGGSTPTKIDLGVTLPAKTLGFDWYIARIFCSPNSNTMNWWIKQVAGAGAPQQASGSVSSNLPSNTQKLALHIMRSAGGTSLQPNSRHGACGYASYP